MQRLTDPASGAWQVEATRTTGAQCRVYTPIFDRPSLKEWVHPEGRVIYIGDASHPASNNARTFRSFPFSPAHRYIARVSLPHSVSPVLYLSAVRHRRSGPRQTLQAPTPQRADQLLPQCSTGDPATARRAGRQGVAR